MRQLKELGDEITANAAELDFTHRCENGYNYSDEEFYTSEYGLVAIIAIIIELIIAKHIILM